MEPNAALLAGLAAGLAIAMQVGAVSLLLVDAAVTAGPRAGVAAGMGVAAADLALAAIAAAAGGAAGTALASHESEIRVIAAIAIAAIAIHGLIAIGREGGCASGSAGTAAVLRGRGPRTYFARFLAITAANPLTIASFAAVAAALSIHGVLAAAAFAAGVGLASAAWHLVLSLAAGHAGRWMTPAVRRGFGVAGRVAVLAIAAHLALG